VGTDRMRPTGVMLRDTDGGLSYLRSASAASALDARDLDPAPVAEARAVLVTGITAMLGRGPQRAALSLLERAGGIRAVDPNLRPGLWGSDRATGLIAPLIAGCDLLLGGEHELGAFAHGTGEALARACARLGPREIVIKRGSAGAAALDPSGTYHEQDPVETTQRDPIGAGDAFNAAYLGARLDGRDVPDALKAAAVAGAHAAATFGDTEGSA
jgi:2-dehydro-3-deoxygluconokinase